jgi:transposase
MRGVFLHIISQCKSERPTEIHKQIVAVYGKVMNRQNVTKWCREFSEGRTDVHDEQRSGRPSLISADLRAGGRLL